MAKSAPAVWSDASRGRRCDSESAIEEGRPSDRPYVPGVNARKYMLARLAHLGSAAAPAVVFMFYVVISVVIAGGSWLLE